MKKTLSRYLLAAVLLPLSGGAFGALLPSFNYLGNWTLSDIDGSNDGFYETITLTNPFGPGAGAVSSFFPSPDGLLGGGEYVGTAFGGSISLTLDPNNFTSGVNYAFNPATYYQNAGDGFALFDNDGTLLFAGDLTATALKVNNSTGTINSIFDLNLSNIVAGASYMSGTSAIVDAFLGATGGAANFSLNIAGSIAAAIEGAAVSVRNGSYSGSASVVPIPAALPLFISALGMLGFFGWRRGHA